MRAQGPGAINDPDFLVVGLDGLGSGGLTTNSCTPLQYRAQFSLWCLAGAPLIMGNDMRNLGEENLETLRNAELIAVDQDPLVRGGRRVRNAGDLQVWTKELVGGRLAVGLYNRGKVPARLSTSWTELGLPAGAAFQVRDLWKHSDLGVFRDAFDAELAPDECLVLRLQPAMP
jgi:alpha-galactosidase